MSNTIRALDTRAGGFSLYSRYGKLPLGIAFQIVLIGFITIRSGAQNLTLPQPGPTPAQNAQINSLTVNGPVNLGTINLTISPNFNPANTGITINSGGNLTADQVKVNISGGLTGVNATATSPGVAMAELSDTTITFNNGGNAGLVANGSGATLTLATASQILMSNGGGSVAALAQNGGTINLSDTTISIVGGGGNFPVIASSGGSVTLDKDVIGVSAGGGNGLKAGTAAGDLVLNQTQGDTVGHLLVTNSQITVGASGGGFGVKATTPGSTATLQDNTSVTVNALSNSGGNFGLIATNSAMATLANTSVTVNAGVGGGNAGILVTNNGKVGVTGGTVLVDSTGNDSGVQLGGQNPQFGTGGGMIEMTGGTVDKSGSNGQAILVSGTTLTGSVNNGTFDGTTVTSVNIGIVAQGTATSTLNFLNKASVTSASTGILAQGSGTSTVNFENGASLTPGNDLLLKVIENAILTLNGENDVHFVGNIDATAHNPGSVSDTLPVRVNLISGSDGGSSLTGWINQNTLTGAAGLEPADPFPFQNLPRQNVNLGIDGNSRWSMTASSTLNTLTVNPGARVTFVDPPSDQPFKTLVMNNLVGTGATFGMNIDLGQIRGDLVAILTSSQGLHLIEFSNRDQSEDLPVNVALLVVKTADGGAGFSGETDGGTFKYFVVHGVDGSTVTPVKQNWYLVRADEIPPPQVTPPPPVDPNPTPPPPKPPGEFTPGEVGPPPEVVVPPIALSPINALTNTANAAIGTYSSTIPVYYADMQTLVERMGELRLGVQTTPGQAPVTSEQLPEGKGVVASKQVAPVPAPPPSSEWGVWVRGFGSGMRINNDASRVFDQNVGGFQIGADKRFGSLWGGDVYLGVFGGYIYASRDFRDGGDGSTNALSLGGYATWIHPKGWYVDMVGKYTQMWNYFNTPTLEGSISTGYYNIPSFGGSLEIGKRFEFASGRFFIEPEAQLAGVWENGMNYTASDGLRVHGDDQTSLRGRLGGRVGMHFDLAQGRAIEPYVRAEAIEEFLTGNTVTTDSTNLDSHLSGTVGRFGGGLTAKLSQSVYIYGEYDYATGDHIEQPWSISAGLRWQW